MIPIKPITFLGETYTAIKIGQIAVDLDASATIPVTIHTTKDEATPSHSRIVKLEAETYAAWGNDDSYIVKAVSSALGVEIG